MHFSAHSLHPSVIISPRHQKEVAEQLSAISKNKSQKISAQKENPGYIEILLTTVSYSGNFDAYIEIQFYGSGGSPTWLMVDSGNSMLIVPRWEDIASIPNYQLYYTVLGTAKEPWGCPANVVVGPIDLQTSTGDTYTLPNCVFYACTDDGPSGGRTANFGAGCIYPWSSNGWNVPPGCDVVMQAPLSYNTTHPCAVFNYAPASEIFKDSGEAFTSDTSTLALYVSAPSAFTLMDVMQNLEWMSVTPQQLTIGSQDTQWPGKAPNPIAMVDTGGGPCFLSDPYGYLYGGSWPDPVACPSWCNTTDPPSLNCNCISDDFTLRLGDGTDTYTYTVSTQSMPPSVQGLTLVMCEVNQFMMQRQGMNIGGISALFNYILVDYANHRVGFMKA